MPVTPSPLTAAPKPAVQVPLLDLKLQYQPLAAEIQAVIAKVCASQAFILGPEVKELEADVAAYSQCRHGVGVSSGTDALLLALMALEIGQGDEVITSPFTFFATAGTIARAGARPLFCDIDPVSSIWPRKRLLPSCRGNASVAAATSSTGAPADASRP